MHYLVIAPTAPIASILETIGIRPIQIGSPNSAVVAPDATGLAMLTADADIVFESDLDAQALGALDEQTQLFVEAWRAGNERRASNARPYDGFDWGSAGDGP